jgi:hypothetical protein
MACSYTFLKSAVENEYLISHIVTMTQPHHTEMQGQQCPFAPGLLHAGRAKIQLTRVAVEAWKAGAAVRWSLGRVSRGGSGRGFKGRANSGILTLRRAELGSPVGDGVVAGNVVVKNGQFQNENANASDVECYGQCCGKSAAVQPEIHQKLISGMASGHAEELGLR